MSKAFTKEDDEIPERVGRARSASGLPPGATNYMTAEGARRLGTELRKAKGARATELQEVLKSATLVPERDEPPEEVLFGTTVTVTAEDGTKVRYRIVGVDEVGLEKEWISWLSPEAKALLGLGIGKRARLPGAPPGEEVTISEIA